MAGGIFLIQEGKLVEMAEQPYESEDVLQAFLARYPNLIAGDQVDSGAPRRWLLVSREVGVPAEDGGSNQWSLDHLFLDQDAVPTLIEVKRSSDTRLRREVVGQLLDYAANAVVYWPVEEVKSKFEARCERDGVKTDVELTRLLQDSAISPEMFWEQVKTNLQAGKIRLLFVADVIPQELRRVVEFLNWQMDPAEVLAVEIKQYADSERTTRTLVPRVIGKLEKAGTQATRGEAWTSERFFDRLSEFDAALVDPARAIYDWSRANGLEVTWGRGRDYGSFTASFVHDGTRYAPYNVWTHGKVQLQLAYLRAREADVPELIRRLNQIPGVMISDDSVDKYPNFSLSVLATKTSLNSFLETMSWLIAGIRSA